MSADNGTPRVRDSETGAMITLARALDPLSPPARRRILAYLSDRFGQEEEER